MIKKSLFIVLLLSLTVACKKEETSTDTSTTLAQNDPLPSWNDSPIKKRILDYVQKATDTASSGFVPLQDRIAVFDNDGTLWPEQPYPNQLQFVFDYIKANKDHITLDPKIKEAVLTQNLHALKGLDMKGLMELVNTAHGNKAVDEFDKSVKTWADTATNKRFNEKYIKVVYKPMLELLEYLRSNGFKTFIVSGGGADFMRVFSEDVYGIPPYQVVGSYGETVYDAGTGQLTKTGKILLVDDKAGKPAGIHTFIGKRPVVCFGNSDGDQAMMEYTFANKQPTLCGLVYHTDKDREFAYDTITISGAIKTALVAAKKNDWLVIDMKKDWNKVFAFEK